MSRTGSDYSFQSVIDESGLSECTLAFSVTNSRSYIVYFAALIVLAVVGALLLARQGITWYLYLGLVLIFLLLMISRVTLPSRSVKKEVAKLFRDMKKKTIPVNVSLSGDAIRQDFDRSSVRTIPYDRIIAIARTKHYLTMIDKDRSMVYIQLSQIKDLPELRRYLKGKCPSAAEKGF